MAKAISLEDWIGVFLLGFIIIVPMITVFSQVVLSFVESVVDITPFSGSGLIAGSIIGIIIFTFLFGVSTRVFPDPLRFKFR